MDIEQYKPSVSLTDSFKIDESLDDKSKAFACLKNLVLVRKAQEAMFLVAGRILKMVRDEKLYKLLDYEHFEDFIVSEEVDFSRESAYLYIRVYEYYTGYLGWGEDQLKKISLHKLGRMIPILKKIENKEEAIDKIHELSGLRRPDFNKEVGTALNVDGKPLVFWSQEESKWIVNYYVDITKLVLKGNYADR